MHRTNVNPWPWSLNFGYSQAQVVSGASRQLRCAGQTAVDGEGIPQHEGDMRAQMSVALDNLSTVLGAAGMTLSHLTRLCIYTTDVDATLRHFDVIGERLHAAQSAPPMTLLGVARLALPSLMIEIEASAAD